MAEQVSTLYFEDSNIRILIARGNKTERWASMPLEPGLVSGGVIIDESKVAKKIQELLIAIQHIKTQASGPKKITDSVDRLFSGKGKIVVGLSGRDSLYRVLSLPSLPDSLLAEAVRREAARILPISLNDLYLAYQRIPGSSNETRVFIAAFPKKACDILLKTLRLAGITPRVLDLAPLAVCLSVNEPRAIVVDARLDAFNIIIMSERVPQVIRSLTLQSETKLFSENMPIIIEEFSRTIAFYNSSHPQDPLNSDVPVFVSGDLVAAPGTWKSLAGSLNFKVSALPSAMQFPADFPINEFVVNIGLATKSLELGKHPGNYSLVNLNALPAKALPKPIDPYRIIIPVVVVVGISGIVLLWNGLQNTQNNTKSLQSQLTSIQSQITANSATVAQLTAQNKTTQSQIQPLKDAANVLNTKLTTLATARNLTDSDVHEIVALAPKSVTLISLTYNTSGSTVTGSASTQADVLQYAQSLRDTGGYGVVVSSINYSTITTDAGSVIGTYQFSFGLN
jgi:type IV pilus assembly protein PilM